MAIEVERLLVGVIVTNSYLVRCSADGEAVVIDPVPMRVYNIT